ncbi:DUF7524 family protein [Halobellus rufus]|uniref:DUF7524 family protein n=1 Tax=Halobellus rufus TaxID=1448860 RepID=UPI000679DF3A|nr:hypothetical protein [Halobellus rufus]
MTESLHVELNDGSVHAIDAPSAFTAEGPFHVEFDNAGGATHVHLHLDDDLSRVSRVDEVNHYVRDGATKRVPIGVLPDRRPVTGRLKIVSGYGAEVSYTELTIVPNATDDAQASSSPNEQSGSTDGSAEQSTDGQAGETAGATEPAVVRRKTTNARTGGTRGSMSVLGGPSASTSKFDALTRAFSADRAAAVAASARRGSPEAVAFLALATAALLVGAGVIVVANDLLVALVVIAVVAATVGVAGWLLLE